MFKSTKDRLIFVTIFSLICIIATALLIMYKKIDIESEQDENKQIESNIIASTKNTYYYEKKSNRFKRKI